MSNLIISKETKKEIKKRIADIEYFKHSAGGRLCGIGIKVVNVKILDKPKRFIADIIVNDLEDNITTRYNDCEYDFLRVISRKLTGLDKEML